MKNNCQYSNLLVIEGLTTELVTEWLSEKVVHRNKEELESYIKECKAVFGNTLLIAVKTATC